MKIDVVEIEEVDDGGAVITFEVDSDVLRLLASEGLFAVLSREIENVREYHSNGGGKEKDSLQTDLEDFTGSGFMR